MRKEEGARSVKQILKRLVERCEECGHRGINITTYRIEEGYSEPRGFGAKLGSILAPCDPEEYREWKKDRARRPGIEVSYYCPECDAEFEQFYDEPTFKAFAQTFK